MAHAPRPSILLTAFDPFGGESENAAEQAVRVVMPPSGIAGFRRVILPTVYGEAGRTLRRAMEDTDADIVLAVGQAGGRRALTPERVAVNLEDAGIPDNAGQRPKDRPVVAGGPAAYFATLPVKRIVEALRADGIPAALSLSAGTFVCNHVMYVLLHTQAGEAEARRAAGKPPALGGFLHLPYLSEQVTDGSRPTIPRDLAVRGIERTLGVSVAAWAEAASAREP